MVGFFDDVPPPPLADDPTGYRPPAWMAPPDNVVGRFADLQPVLVQGPDAAVVVDGFVAYPSGVEFRLSVRTRGEVQDANPFFWRRPRPGSDGLPSELLRVGLGFADGTRATNLEGWPPLRVTGGAPPGPVLRFRGGGGAGRRWEAEVWFWPLPPPGPVTLVLEWPGHEIPETRAELSADPLLAAAEQAIELWPEDRPEPSPGGPARFAR